MLLSTWVNRTGNIISENGRVRWISPKNVRAKACSNNISSCHEALIFEGNWLLTPSQQIERLPYPGESLNRFDFMSAHEIFISKDPRVGSKFRPQFFPLSDFGEAPPVDTSNRNDRIR